jgi:hypothetical protein
VMTNAELFALLATDAPLNRARKVFSSWRARIENESEQGLSPVIMRKMEFEAVAAIVAEHNKELRDVLQKITDHFADVMGGPMVSGRGITFENGVEGIPTIKAARMVLNK